MKEIFNLIAKHAINIIKRIVITAYI